MRDWPRLPLGLAGRILAVLLLAVLVEFAASTFLYERASEFMVRQDGAKRLAEHLVIARKLVNERPPADRPAMASRLTTLRYDIHWTGSHRELPHAPVMDEVRREIIQWEPSLGQADMRLRASPAKRNGIVAGSLRLADGSWLEFSTRDGHPGRYFAVDRVVTGLISAIALLVIGSLLIRRTLRPMRSLSLAARRIGLGQEMILAETGTGEVRRVIRSFNEMQRRIHRLIAERTQALAAVGHDLRTPLARLQLRLDGLDDPAARAAIGEDVAEMEAMVGSLLAFLNGEADPERPIAIDLAVTAQTVADDAADRGHDVVYDGPDHLETRIRPTAIKRALGNLIENALHYGGSARVLLVPRDGEIELRVEDDGPGIPEDRLEAVLQPFVRLDGARSRNTKGLGLGLSIVAQAAEREGGRLVLSNRPEGGLSAALLLPRN